jgi:hypothetical protein
MLMAPGMCRAGILGLCLPHWGLPKMYFRLMQVVELTSHDLLVRDLQGLL